MTEWGTCHKDRLCATVLAWESWCVSNIPCLIGFTKILNFGEAWFPDPIRCCKNLRFSIYSVYIPTLFIFLSHPAFVSHLYHSVIIVQHFFHELRFIGGARETSSVITENWMYVLAQLKISSQNGCRESSREINGIKLFVEKEHVYIDCWQSCWHSSLKIQPNQREFGLATKVTSLKNSVVY